MKILFSTYYFKITTQYHYPSTIVKGIVRTHKQGKNNRHQNEVTNCTLKSTSFTKNSHDTLNDKTVVADLEQITTREYETPSKDIGFGTNLKNDIKCQSLITPSKFTNSVENLNVSDQTGDKLKPVTFTLAKLQ